MITARPLFRSLIALCFALSLSCREDPTYAVLEVASNLGGDLTRVEVAVRDAQDHEMFDRYSFDADVSSEYRVPFSFVLEPRARADQEVVVTATGYSRSELLSETKLRVRLARGKTTRHSLLLSAACRGVSACPSGQACDPALAECGEIPSQSSPQLDDSVRVRTGVAGAAGRSTDQAGQAGQEEAGSGGSMEMGQGGKGPNERAAAGSSGRAGKPADTAGSDAAAGRGGAAAGGAGQTGAAGRTAAGSGGTAAGASGAGGAGGAGGVDGAGGRLGMSGVAGGGELQGSAHADVESEGQAYVVTSNVYGPGMQTLRYEGTSFTVTNQTGEAQNGVAFFAVYTGTQYKKASAGTNLPLRADLVESIDVSITTNAGAVPGTYQMLNAMWFSAGPAADGNLPTGGYLEIWHYVQTPHNPPGNKVVSGLQLSRVSGAYDVWQGSCSGRPCTTYVRTEPATSFIGDLAPFLEDALGRPNGVDASWYLNAVYAGFDVAAGGTGLSATAISERVR